MLILLEKLYVNQISEETDSYDNLSCRFNFLLYETLKTLKNKDLIS